ncbi:TPA: hypothetical protein ACH3X1_006512 [Trebouxia sp. C0004]
MKSVMYQDLSICQVHDDQGIKQLQAASNRSLMNDQHASHKLVCLVPDSVDEYLLVPDRNLQKSLNTYSEGVVSADIGITTDITFNVNSTCVVRLGIRNVT